MNRKDRRRSERIMRQENNEAQRRAEMIIARETARKSAIAKIEKNGITIDDLEREYKKGFDSGFAKATEPVYKTMMAAIALALHELHGFGQKRIKDVLQCVDNHVMYSLTSTELAEEVLEKTGLEILFHETFDRIQEKT